MNKNTTLIPDQILVGEELYAEAINIILSSAKHELVIFDQDLSHGDFTSNQKLNLFQQFLNKARAKYKEADKDNRMEAFEKTQKGLKNQLREQLIRM